MNRKSKQLITNLFSQFDTVIDEYDCDGETIECLGHLTDAVEWGQEIDWDNLDWQLIEDVENATKDLDEIAKKILAFQQEYEVTSDELWEYRFM